ncbi:ATP-binding protein [Clostridium sp. BL-8]|uniref:MASE3 domain-containing sensor histidine kinase n=1 Tax=Clostridium sp. BL-8 TaxID=349938 RepID=UPI00098BDC3E|nr:ATP-binding protein [Clostridium sp. BL-8]OOM77984.1 sensor histidine kinase TodS [Clostridium sp. BL-8]
MYNLSINQKKLIEFFILAFLFLSLNFIGKQNYILFNNIIEIMTVILGFTLIVVSINTIKTGENNYFHILAIIFGFVSIINLFYILLSGYYNRGIQLNIFDEYYECVMLIISFNYINKKIYWHKMLYLHIIIAIFIVLGIIGFNFIIINSMDKYFLTLLYQISKGLLAICFTVTFLSIMKCKVNVLNNNKYGLLMAVVFEILSCISFIIYGNVYGAGNILGNLFKLIACYYAFKATLKGIIIDPYTNLFEKFENKAYELENVNEKLYEANHKIQNIEKLNERFINLIPDGLLIVRDRKIESANKRFLDMLEIDNENELKNKLFIEILDKQYHGIFLNRINSPDKGVLERQQEYEFVWKNRKKWVETTSLIVNDEDGEYIISAIRNIEDRKKAEEAVQLLELKRKEENMKNDFFANISHELRTPINVIYSALQVENNYLEDDSAKKLILKYNKIIRQNCLRLMRLINNIIDITKIETSFFKPNCKIENIVSVVEDITMSIIEYAESKKIKLIFDTEVEEAYVSCDSDLIERIMLNLLSNAVKYGKENGGIEVYICKSSENSISISVKDDGIGIPDEMKVKIFDRFLKVDNSLSRRTEGSGIGLSLVKQLVEIHKGTITCNSKLNEGSEFEVIFPTVEYSINTPNTEEINQPKNAIKPTEIEFSDIYY